MRLLYITAAIDPAHSKAGHVYGWIAAFAPYCERIDAIGVEVARGLAPPQNVRVFSLGKEKGASRAEKLARFYMYAGQLVPHSDVIFCQFSSTFVLAVAPIAKLWRRPMALWWTHKHTDWKLWLAEKLVDRVATASPESFRIPSAKVVTTGHGIDTDVFVPGSVPRPAPRRFTITSVGRIAPIKRLELLIDAADLLVNRMGFRDLSVRLVGGIESPGSEYFRSLQGRISEKGLTEFFAFAGPVPFENVVQEYWGADASFNGCPTGGVDKVVLESMSCGVPPLVANRAFERILGPLASQMLFDDLDSEDLARRLMEVARLSAEAREELGQRLRRLVIEGHSLDALARRIIEDVLAPVATASSPARVQPGA